MFKKISNKFFKKFKHLRTSQKKRIFKGFCLGSIFVFIFSINISRLGLFSEKIFDFFSIFLPITLIFYFGFEKVRTKKLEKFDISKTLLYFLPLLVFILIKSIILQLEQIDMFMCVGSICIFWILASILENKKDLNFFIFVTMLYGIFESFIFLKQTDLLSNQNLLLKIADISATNIISSKLLLDISANYFLNLLALIFFIFTLPIAQNRRFANIYKIFAIFVCLFMFIILYNSFSYTSLIIFFIFCISYPFIFKSIDKNIQILKILAFFILAFLGSFLFLKNNFTYSGNKEKTYIEYFYHEQESQSANKNFAEKTLYENLKDNINSTICTNKQIAKLSLDYFLEAPLFGIHKSTFSNFCKDNSNLQIPAYSPFNTIFTNLCFNGITGLLLLLLPIFVIFKNIFKLLKKVPSFIISDKQKFVSNTILNSKHNKEKNAYNHRSNNNKSKFVKKIVFLTGKEKVPLTKIYLVSFLFIAAAYLFGFNYTYQFKSIDIVLFIFTAMCICLFDDKNIKIAKKIYFISIISVFILSIYLSFCYIINKENYRLFNALEKNFMISYNISNQSSSELVNILDNRNFKSYEFENIKILSKILYDNKGLDSSLKSCNALIEKYPHAPNLKYTKAYILALCNNFDEAIDLLNANKENQNSKHLYYLAWAYAAKGSPENYLLAINAINKASQLKPNSENISQLKNKININYASKATDTFAIGKFLKPNID